MAYYSCVNTSCQYIYFCYKTHMHIDLENEVFMLGLVWVSEIYKVDRNRTSTLFCSPLVPQSSNTSFLCNGICVIIQFDVNFLPRQREKKMHFLIKHFSRYVCYATAVISRSHEGPGEMGKAVNIPKDEQEKMKELFKINQFNLMASDMIALNRSLPDVRLDGCVKLIAHEHVINSQTEIKLHRVSECEGDCRGSSQRLKGKSRNDVITWRDVLNKDGRAPRNECVK